MQYMRGKRRSEPPCKAFRSDTDDGPDPVDLIPSPAPGPSHDIEKDELAGEVRKAIGLLPDRERLIIELSIIRERKSGEIADMLGIPRGTVSCCARRARHKLKKYLKNLQR